MEREVEIINDKLKCHVCNQEKNHIMVNHDRAYIG